MIIKSAEFIKSAVKPSHYPPAVLPEIAFAGRSNVGKSSLINTLINRKHLVRTSSIPGRTQLINFFVINRAFSFVDLPGYGYAKVPSYIQKNWGPMIETYLSYRETLKGILFIMDIRRMPGKYELELIEWFDHYNIPSVLILTKADKLSKSKQIKQHLSISKVLSVNKNYLILFSSKSRQGNNDVWDAVENLL